MNTGLVLSLGGIWDVVDIMATNALEEHEIFSMHIPVLFLHNSDVGLYFFGIHPTNFRQCLGMTVLNKA